MSLTRVRIRPPPPEAPPAERPSPLVTFGATSLIGLVAFAVSWALQRLGAGMVATAALGIALAAAAGVRTKRLGRATPRRPWWSQWDVVGYAASLSLAGVATILAVEALRPAPGLFRSTQVALPVAVSGIVFFAAVTVARIHGTGLSFGTGVRNLVRIWSDPPADWAFFVLGAVLTMPLAALISHVLWDSDSGRILQDASQVRHSGLGLLVDSQQVFLPMLIFPPVIAVAGVYGATALSVITMQALAGVIGYITRKLTGGVLAPITAILVLLSLKTLVWQAHVLPMYPLMLALGYLAGWVGLRSLRGDGRVRLGLAVVTAFLLAATAESHDIGKLFFAVPLFLLALEPTRKGLKGAAMIYLFLALFSIPRALVNVSDGGLAWFAINRTDWMVTSGYTRLINAVFWDYPVYDKPQFFAQLFRTYFGGPDGLLLALPSVLALVAFAISRWRMRAFGLLCAGLMIVGLFDTNAPPHPRYLAPVLPGLALAAGIGMWYLVRLLRRSVPLILLSGLALGALISFVSVVNITHARQEQILSLELDRTTDRIDDDRAVAGVRAISLMSADPSLPLLSNKYFTEQEWLTYLTWPSDERVLEILRAHDVGWVVVQGSRKLEVAYDSTWVRRVYGRRVRHADMIARSPSFCAVLWNGGYWLYQIASCPEDASPQRHMTPRFTQGHADSGSVGAARRA